MLSLEVIVTSCPVLPDVSMVKPADWIVIPLPVMVTFPPLEAVSLLALITQPMAQNLQPVLQPATLLRFPMTEFIQLDISPKITSAIQKP